MGVLRVVLAENTVQRNTPDVECEYTSKDSVKGTVFALLLRSSLNDYYRKDFEGLEQQPC